MTRPKWTTACPDWEERIKAGRSLMPCGPIFPDEAEKGMQVFRSLLAVNVQHPLGLVDSEGRTVTPTAADVCRDWQLEIAQVIHGAYDVRTGERMIRELFVKVPKKNWKSGLMALVMLSLLVRSWRPSNEGAVIAPTKEAADNVFKPMRDAIKADPELSVLFHVQPVMRTVTHRVTGMSCRVYAADTDTVVGKIWAFVIFDELWQLAKRSHAEDMILEALGGQASRPEGVVISITTESDDEPVGVYKAKLEYARAIRDGLIHAPHFLPLIYEWPADMLKSRAYMNPDNFGLVNPNYGTSVDPVDMRQKFDEAVAAGGKSLRVFLAKRLNVPPSENVGGSWAGAEFWQQCGDKTLTFESLIQRSEVVCIGGDGGGLDDLLGFTALGREKDTGKWLWWSHAWAHPVVLERRKELAPRLKDFEVVGDLTMVKEVGQDAHEFAALCSQVFEAGLLDKIGLDPSSIGGIMDALILAGIPQEAIVGVRQGPVTLNGPILTTERELASKKIVHGCQPIMVYCVSNAKVEKRGNAIIITKEKSSGKIDPLMAGFNAVFLMSMNPASCLGKHQFFVLGG